MSCPYKLALTFAIPFNGGLPINGDVTPVVVNAASTFALPVVPTSVVKIKSVPPKEELKLGPLNAAASKPTPAKAPLYKSLATAVELPFVRSILTIIVGAKPPNVVVAGNVGSVIA